MAVGESVEGREVEVLLRKNNLACCVAKRGGRCWEWCFEARRWARRCVARRVELRDGEGSSTSER